MNTDNLNEMIQQVSFNPVDVDEPDFVYTLQRDKWLYDEDSDDELDAETPVAESIIPQILDQSIVDLVVKEVDPDNYHPESEEELISYTMEIHNKVQTYSIGGYWEIGRTINSYYQGKYGTRELERIANATGIGRDTLNKMCKFANQYSKDQVDALLSGAFPVSWFQISQNLTLEADTVIKVYQETEDPKQFHNSIMKFKNPQESRGKSKSTSVAIPAAVHTPSITTGVAEVSVVKEIQLEEIIAITADQAPGDHGKEVDDLRVENEKLRKDLEQSEDQVNHLQIWLRSAELEVTENRQLIEKLKDTLQQIYRMIDNGCHHANMLSDFDWRIMK